MRRLRKEVLEVNVDQLAAYLGVCSTCIHVNERRGTHAITAEVNNLVRAVDPEELQRFVEKQTERRNRLYRRGEEITGEKPARRSYPI